MSSEWTPFQPTSARIPHVDIATVRIVPSGTLILSMDIVEQLGSPEHVGFLTNESDDHIGLIAVPVPGYTLLRYPSRSNSRLGGPRRAVNAHQILWHCGRRAAVQVLPHRFDGDVLVIDISGLPTKPKRGAP